LHSSLRDALEGIVDLDCDEVEIERERQDTTHLDTIRGNANGVLAKFGSAEA
jgi:hypothetical protein